MIKVSKSTYIQCFGIIIIVLALIRCAFPHIADDRIQQGGGDTAVADSDSLSRISMSPVPASRLHIDSIDGKPVFHRIYSVPNFDTAFPDSQDVQLSSAQKYGVKPVADSNDALARKNELVFVGANPYFYVENLKSSIPYLVPRASTLLSDIGRLFFDSLYVKGVPLHKIIVTSVLRTQRNVENLRLRNNNATENSCHMYGTTFDICYNRYKTVQNPQGPQRREVQNDTLKWVLSEVLRDLRQSGRCHIKYEKNQSCFHITVR